MPSGVVYRRLLTVAALFALLTGSALANQRGALPASYDVRARSSIAFPKNSKPTNWSQFGYDPGHTWYNPKENILNPSNVGTLQQAWSFSTGATNTAGNVVEADGVVYASSTSGMLFALNASTGAQLWTFASGAGYASSGSTPAVDHGLVFTLCNLPSGAQGLCALQAATGAVQWEYTVPGATTFAAAPPVVSGGMVYFGACGTTCAYIALKEKSGNVLWSTPEPSECLMNNGIPPAIYQGVLFGVIDGCDEADIITLDASTGAPGWSLPLGSGTLGGMTVAQDRVSITTNLVSAVRNDVYVLTISGGLSWVSPGGDGLANPSFYPAVAYGTLYTPIVGGTVAFKLRVGGDRPKIDFEFGGNEPSAAIANGLLFSDYNGNPSALGPYQQALYWETAFATPSVAGPIIVNGVVYGACDGSDVCAWTLPSMLHKRR